MHTLFTALPSLNIHLKWTPGHCGVVRQVMADKTAKKGMKQQGQLLDNFHLKAWVKEQQKTDLKTRWKEQWKNQQWDIKLSSSFHLASQHLRTPTKPDKLFKKTPWELFSRLAQTLMGHGYTGEYYSQFVPTNPVHCNCPLLGPLLQTLENPGFSLTSLFQPNNLLTLCKWMK